MSINPFTTEARFYVLNAMVKYITTGQPATIIRTRLHKSRSSRDKLEFDLSNFVNQYPSKGLPIWHGLPDIRPIEVTNS